MSNFDELFEDDAAMFDNEDVDEGPQFREEADAYERTGPSGRLSEMISANTMGDLQRELAHRSPEERFLISVDAISRRMASDHIANISESDITNMLTKTGHVQGLRYKNPVGYILGYLASRGGREIKHDTVMNVITKVLPKLGDEGGVAPPDVIRYARFWKKYL
jgi:hypothetical protein